MQIKPELIIVFAATVSHGFWQLGFRALVNAGSFKSTCEMHTKYVRWKKMCQCEGKDLTTLDQMDGQS